MNMRDERFESVQRLKCLTPELRKFFAAHAISTCGQALEFAEKALGPHRATQDPVLDPATLIAVRQELLEMLPPGVVSEIRDDCGAQWRRSFRPGVPLDDPVGPGRDQSPQSIDEVLANEDEAAESGDDPCKR